MAARKLQTEIDRTIKKVAEGVELFESIYDKMQCSTNQTQKEKLETDLKTQIKKLQRLRDQIKTWVASNDIKDKSILLENRKLIETVRIALRFSPIRARNLVRQMEKFKACEKEMKTKAFSKEGLTQSAKLDPKAQEKQEVTSWLQQTVEDLTLQVEQAEAEIETLQGTGKKRGKGQSAASGRLEDLEHLNERRKWHINRLELILRLLDNGSLSTERVLTVKEDVTYFVENNTDETFEDDEGLYDDLNLGEEEEKFGLVNDDDDASDGSESGSEDHPQRTPKKHDKDDESTLNSKRDESPIQKKSGLQIRKPSLAADNRSTETTPKSELRPTTNGEHPESWTTSSAAPTSCSSPYTLRRRRRCRRIIGTLHELNTINDLHFSNKWNVKLCISDSSNTDGSINSTFDISGVTPRFTTNILTEFNTSVCQDSPAISEAVPSSVSGPAASSSPHRMYHKEPAVSPVLPMAASAAAAAQPAGSLDIQQPQQQPPANGTSQVNQPPVQQPQPTVPSPLPQQVQILSSTSTSTLSTITTSTSAPSAIQPPQYPPGVKVPHSSEQATTLPTQSGQQTPAVQRPPSAVSPQQAPSRPSASMFPGSLSDLVASFETVKQKAPHRMNNLGEVHKLLEGGYSNAPQPTDTERQVHGFCYSGVYLTSPALFQHIDVETLFYVFYYLPGTYQQYLAAKELKRQSWRFHIKYLTWFQRHSEPQAITEEYEQGVYVYFDWEGSWCQRKKSDFRFEYRYLSED
ncbi:hypothetical protein ID866_5202 [Astraeus odoratus]|nr:hypothetical protein ID866_5202 [Astraeus odoratus]